MKTIVITGAGKGIGFETTKQLLKDNFSVIAISRNTIQLNSIASKNLQIIQGDLTSEIDRIIEEIGMTKIDGLLNNAGIIIKKDIHSLTYDDFQSVFQTNVFVPFNLSVRLLNNYNSGAHIINIGSMGGFENTLKFPEMVFYSSSKSALHCLSQCLAVEFKGLDVKVNCLSIGSVETEMVKIAFPGFQPPITSQTMSEFIAWFLVHGQKFMNGQIIPVALDSI